MGIEEGVVKRATEMRSITDFYTKKGSPIPKDTPIRFERARGRIQKILSSRFAQLPS